MLNVEALNGRHGARKGLFEERQHGLDVVELEEKQFGLVSEAELEPGLNSVE